VIEAGPPLRSARRVAIHLGKVLHC
jgi:hypothetical protein